MHEETIVVEYEADQAKRALPRLITSAADRRHAHELLEGIRTHFKLDERQLRVVEEIRALLPAPSKSNAALPRRAVGKPAPRKGPAPARRARRTGA
jgi:hypothetical protein